MHDLSREMPSKSEFEEFVAEIEKANSRAAVLVLCAFLDNILERAIALNFIPLNREKRDSLFRDKGAPLSPFSAKILLAHAIGILDNEQRSQLDRIRSIRNAFAHSARTIDFDNNIINDECKKLDPQRLLKQTYVPTTGSARERFIITAIMISTDIMHYTSISLAKPAPLQDKSGQQRPLLTRSLDYMKKFIRCLRQSSPM